MGRPLCYRPDERAGDPTLAPAFGALLLGAGLVAIITGVGYRSVMHPLSSGVATGLGALMLVVASSFWVILRRNVLFAHADEEGGLLVRMGHGARLSVPWNEVARVVRAVSSPRAKEATLYILTRGRVRLTFPPGEGQEELYDLAAAVLDGKKGRRRRSEPARADGPGEAAAGIRGVPMLLWALVKLAAFVVAGLLIAMAVARPTAIEKALFVAMAFEVGVPIALFPPSATGAVVRAVAGPKGLAYQSIVYGTRVIPWDRLATARVYTMGQVLGLSARFLEFFDLDGGRLQMSLPRNPAFLKCVDGYLGTRLSERTDVVTPAHRPRGRRLR